MNNVSDSMLPKVNGINNSGSIHFTPNIPKKTTQYYNFLFNPKNNNCNNSSLLVNNNIKIKNYSNPKYKNRSKFKNKLITKHYSICSNVQSVNDKKLSNFCFKKPTITEPSCNLNKFLPPKKTEKKTLVIDLDETLVHSYFDKYPPRKPDICFEITLDGKNVQVYTLVRPGAIQFLEKISTIYEIVIFTASLSIYALPIINFIDKNKKCDFKLFREHCSSFNNGFIKDLKRLSRDLKNLIIVDNNPNCYFLNKENAFPIKTWIDDASDKELFKIFPYLEFLSKDSIKDIRPILSNIKRGNEIIYYKFDKIIKKYKKKQTNNNKNEDKKVNEENKEENNIPIQNNIKIETKEINIKHDLNINKDKENEKNNDVFENDKIIKKDENENNSIKNENENNIISIENNNIKNDFRNKMISSKGHRFFISKSKNNQENYSENRDLRNNIFNHKINNNQIKSQKANFISTTIKYSSRGIFLKNKESTEKKQDELFSDLFPKQEIKPFINNINLHSNIFEKPIIKNELNIQKEYKKNNNESPNIYSKNKSYFQTSKNYDNFNNIYLYCNKTNNNFNKNISLGKNIIKSNSEKKNLLYNYKSIEDINKNIFDEVKDKYLDHFNININNKNNRSISSYKRDNYIIKNYNSKKNYNNRCLSSHQHFIGNYNKFNYISNNF